MFRAVCGDTKGLPELLAPLAHKVWQRHIDCIPQSGFSIAYPGHSRAAECKETGPGD